MNDLIYEHFLHISKQTWYKCKDSTGSIMVYNYIKQVGSEEKQLTTGADFHLCIARTNLKSSSAIP